MSAAPAPEPTGSGVAPSSRDGTRVVVATFGTLGLVYGFWYAYSVFFVAFLREFGWSRSLVAGVFSVLVVVHGLVGPLLGWLTERIGPRRLIMAGAAGLALGTWLAAETTRAWHLYLSLGLVGGVGISAAGWVPSVALVRAWFPTRVGTALGIASGGIGVGIATMLPLTQFLIEQVGWRWALRVLGLLILVWVVPATAWLVRDRVPAEGGATRSRPEPAAPSWDLHSALRSARFWGVFLAFASAACATQMLLAHQVAYLVDHGVPALVAASVVSVVGVASIVGKAGWGALSDRIGREPAYSAAAMWLLLGIGVLWLAGRYPASVLPYVYAVLVGVGYAATAPLTPAIASDLFGGPRFARIFGALSLANSAGAGLGAWAAGRVFDWTGSYGPAFATAAGMVVLAPAALWLVAAPRRPNPPPLTP